MLYCKKCNVKISGTPNFCPLCQGELSGEPECGNSYPPVKHKRDYLSLAIRIAAMLTIAGVCICAAVNYSVNGSFAGWWLYVAGAAASFWISFGTAVKRRRNVSKSIMFSTLVICIIAFLWDLLTGYKGWSLDFVLPIASCTAMLAMAIIARVLNLQIEQYIYYLILDIVFGIIPLVLLLFRVIRFAPPSVACVAVSIISLAALLLFQGKALRAEIIRRTHL